MITFSWFDYILIKEVESFSWNHLYEIFPWNWFYRKKVQKWCFIYWFFVLIFQVVDVFWLGLKLKTMMVILRLMSVSPEILWWEEDHQQPTVCMDFGLFILEMQGQIWVFTFAKYFSLRCSFEKCFWFHDFYFFFQNKNFESQLY